MSVLQRAGWWVIGLGPVIAGLTERGLAALVVLAVLVLLLAVLGRGMMRWIIGSETRSDRVIRMMLAWRGKTRSPVHVGREGRCSGEVDIERGTARRSHAGRSARDATGAGDADIRGGTARPSLSARERS